MSAPSVAVLVDHDLPPNLAEIGRIAEVRTARAEGLDGALDGAEVLLAWDFLTPALAGARAVATATADSLTTSSPTTTGRNSLTITHW